MPTIVVDVYSVSVSPDTWLARKLYQAELPPDRLTNENKQFMRFVTFHRICIKKLGYKKMGVADFEAVSRSVL